jgi:hypothetical protein
VAKVSVISPKNPHVSHAIWNGSTLHKSVSVKTVVARGVEEGDGEGKKVAVGRWVGVSVGRGVFVGVSEGVTTGDPLVGVYVGSSCPIGSQTRMVA